MTEEGGYTKISSYAAVGSGIITFICAYIYCMSSYGFLLGFGLGWIPSLMLAYLVGLISFFIWPLYALIIGAAIWAFIK